MPAFCLKTQSVKLFRFLTDRDRLDGNNSALKEINDKHNTTKKQNKERRRLALEKLYADVHEQQTRNQKKESDDKLKQDTQAPKLYKHDMGRRDRKSAQSKKPLKSAAYKKGSR